MSNVIHAAEECVGAMESALDAMDPPIDVYECVLKLIAEFVEPYSGKHKT